MAGTGEPDWIAIRAEYEDGNTRIAAHGITKKALRRRRLEEGWRLRHTKPTGAGHDAPIGPLFGLFENQLVQGEILATR